jgi:hypothetical protein
MFVRGGRCGPRSSRRGDLADTLGPVSSPRRPATAVRSVSRSAISPRMGARRARSRPHRRASLTRCDVRRCQSSPSLFGGRLSAARTNEGFGRGRHERRIGTLGVGPRGEVRAGKTEHMRNVGGVRVAVWMSCVVWGSVLVGCGSTVPGEGEACSPSNACAAGLSCVNDAAGAPRCMRTCTRGSVVCDDGAACVDLTTAGAVCWLGGTTPLGSGCSGGTQCARGGVCVSASTGADPTCQQACLPPSADFCAAGQSCVATSSGGGFCRD